jgi:hypothetical protein
MPEEPFVPDLSLWEAWHPREAARCFAELDVPWCVAAGWALDLFRGRQTREHEDLEVAVPEGRFDEVRAALTGLELYVVGDGLAHPLSTESLATHHQTWAREPTSGKWRLDVMREPWEDDTWVFRRDRRVRLPVADAIGRTKDGIPYAQPEIVLLFKAKAMRQKDEEDFATLLPLLDRTRRRWLADALELVQPGHSWLQGLGSI